MIKQIRFKELDHTYRDEDNSYLGCTTFLKGFVPDTDWDFWLLYKATEEILAGKPNDAFDFGLDFRFWGVLKFAVLKDNAKLYRYLEKTQWKPLILKKKIEIKGRWDKAKIDGLTKGKIIHQEKEDEAYDKDFIKIGRKQIGLVRQYNYDLFSLPDGSYSELLVYWSELLLCGTADKVIIETINGSRYIDVDDWKGLALDTPIATETGWTTINDIQINDRVFDGNGELTDVIHVSEVHYNPCYKITFDTNDEIICDHEHKWLLNDRKRDGTYVEKQMRTDKMAVHYTRKNVKMLSIKCTSIKLEKDIELPIDPYVLGLWLADGNRTCGTICKPNTEIWNEIKRRRYQISHDHNIMTDKSESRTVYNLRGDLIKLNLLNNKHIPDLYLRASHNQRLDLLRGFMDGDGYFNRPRKRCVMDTTQKWQADAIITLTSSLGYKPSVFKIKVKGFGKENIPAWSVCFSPKDNPFLIRNKDYDIFMRNVTDKYTKNRYIKNIELVETVPTKCLGVASNTHTYLVGKSFIKTHNTNKQIKYKEFNKYKAPLEHLYYNDINHYGLQISFYAYILSLWGFKIRSTRFTHITPIGDIPYEFKPMIKEMELLFDYRKQQLQFT